MKCKKMIPYGNWGRSRQCSNTSMKDGYCNTHHPVNAEARTQKRECKYKAKELLERVRTCAPHFRMALEKIAKGDFNTTQEAMIIAKKALEVL